MNNWYKSVCHIADLFCCLSLLKDRWKTLTALTQCKACGFSQAL